MTTRDDEQHDDEAPRPCEETLLEALRASGLGLHEVDVLARTVRLDDRARSFWGLAPDAPVTFEVLLAGIHPEDRDAQRAAYERAIDPSGDGRYVSEYRVVRASDGCERCISATGVVTLVAGEPTRLVGTLEDVTDARRAQSALRAAEERLRLLDALGEATRTASEPWSVMKMTAELVGTHLRATRCAYADVEADGDRFTIRDDWAVAGVESTVGTYSLETFGHEVAGRLRQGHTLVVSDVGRQLADDDGGDTFRSIGIRAIVTCPLVKEGRLVALMAVHQATPRAWTTDEVSLIEQAVDRSWAHIERVRAAAKLCEQDRRKDEFLAILAHELRNPLAPIRTGLGVLQRNPTGEAADRARELMERQLGHMVRLIDDLMDVSRISRGKLELKRSRVTVQRVVEHALDASRPLVEAAGHHLTVDVPDEPLWVEGDLTRLAQVVSNLLNNAAKYTPRGGHLAVTAKRAGARAEICVADDGDGIPAEIIGDVFDLFSQGNRTPQEANGGWASDSLWRVSSSRCTAGALTAESAGPRRGSTFTARLPLAVEVRAAPSAPVEAPVPDPGAPRRILVVDDNVDGAEMLATMLELSGHQTRTAHDGAGALAEAHAFRPDVVFLDIGLPDMTGYDVARGLRADTTLDGTTLVALTGWGGDDAKQQARDAGFDFHLTKPVDPARVEALLAR